MDTKNSKGTDFENQLTLKILGKHENVIMAISELNRLYPKEKMNFSPIMKNKEQHGYHCFVNISLSTQEF
jgi:hypothetical protein